MNETIHQTETFSARCQKVLQVAKQLYQGKPDWVTFFRETLGVNGAARSVFPSQDEYAQFEQSREFSEIQKLVAGLRTRKAGSGKNEATKVITVRLPESLHEALKHEASDHNTSMNKLCISKLLQVLVDEEEEAAAGNKPSANRPSEYPIAGTIGQPQSVPSRSAQAAAPSQPPSFRSTYGQNPPSNAHHGPRFGQ